MRNLTVCAAALAVAALAGTASAQDAQVAFNVVGTSDYVFRGFSQTGEDPAIQGGVDLTIGSVYLGAWASNVDFGDSTDAEIDVYGGYRWESVGVAWDVGVVGYFYAPGSNSDYDYVEVKVAGSRAIGPLTVGAAAYFSPDFFGVDDEATYLEANAAITPADKWTVSGAIGKQWLSTSDDYSTWNAGVAYAITENVALDLRYYDTDVKNVPIASDRVVGTVKLLF
ncbi:TorF family putative porin [Brevundimonas variabilis]|uniref:Uncharacterized protein (TIGR02001 family) n=1 Tax=Brevundimonas variabilis TaxID=74312 RepID=A0A7W9CKC8_9CAUL|nr:TorF family putative porin [Brevundimonas variabilis]MBB5746792.1 uncharacterized protein (TIGR02001 family) [Brevundimonas variabilis]